MLDVPPGAYDWIRRVELPLSPVPGAPTSRWIAGGWIVGEGSAPEPLTRRGLVETGYEEPSFIVLESQPDGWLRVRYAPGAGSDGTAWVPRCALGEGPVLLDYTPWSEWLLSDRISPLYFRSDAPAELRSGPAATSQLLAEISGDHILEPLEVRGEWMRVVVKQPSDYCGWDIEVVRREGWVRWYSAESGPRVWYFSRGC